MTTLKQKITDALMERDDDAIAALAVNDKRALGKLISMALNKDDVLCWRAIEAMGVCATTLSRENPASVRNIAQRILWSAREESGGMGWSAPELLAEIVIAAPRQFPDFPPIIVSLHSEDEEKVFLKGVLRAAGRMGEAGITGIPGSDELIRSSLGHEDAGVRGLAIWAAPRAGIAIGDVIGGLTADKAKVRVYEDGELAEYTVGELARQALASAA